MVTSNVNNKPLCKITFQSSSDEDTQSIYDCGGVRAHTHERVFHFDGEKVRDFSTIVSEYVEEIWSAIDGPLISCVLIDVFLSNALLCFLSDGFLKENDLLVGVEPNPGPVGSKNCGARVPTLKRAHSNESIRRKKLEARQRKKEQDAQRNEKKKLAQFLGPEMSVDASLDCHLDSICHLEPKEYVDGVIDFMVTNSVINDELAAQMYRENSSFSTTPSAGRSRESSLYDDISDCPDYVQLGIEAGWIPVDISINDDTKAFLNGLMAHLGSSVKEINVKHGIDVGFHTSLKGFWDWFTTLPSKLYDFLLGLLRVVSGFLPESVARVVDSILLFLGLSRPEEEEAKLGPESLTDAAATLVNLWTDSLSEWIPFETWSKFVKAFLLITRNAKLADGMFDVCIKVLRVVAVFINDTFGTSLPVLGDDETVKKFAERARLLANELRDKGSADNDLCERAFILRDELEYYALARGGRIEPHLKERVNHILKIFQSVVNVCERSFNPRNGTRVEPVAILIAGATGSGKSTLTMPFLLAYLAEILKGDEYKEFMENHNNLIFYRNTECEFWDGHTSKHIVLVYDDFGQMKDVAGTPNPDAMEIIRGKNTAPYHLHMAAIDDKIKHYARHRVMYATTNRTSFHFESIECSEAVIRRFDVRVLQVPKVEFCKDGTEYSFLTRRLDLDKVRAALPLNYDDPETYASLEAMEYIEWDFMQGKPAPGGKVYNFDSLLDHCVALYDGHSRKGDHMLSFLNYMKVRRATKSEPTLAPEMDIFGKEVRIDRSELYSDGFVGLLQQALDAVGALDVVVNDGSCKLVVKPWITGMVKFSALLVSFSAALRVFDSMARWLFPRVYAEYGKGNAGRLRRRGKKNVTKAEVSKMSPESFVPASAYDLTDKLFARNMYLLKYGENMLGYVIFVRGHTFVAPKHYFDLIEDNITEAEPNSSLIQFCSPSTLGVCATLNYDKDLLDITEYGDNYDFIIARVNDRKMRKHTDIVKFFPSAKDPNFDGRERYTAVMSLFDKDKNRWVNNSFTLSLGTNLPYQHQTHEYTSRFLRYVTNTRQGDCGTPIVVADTRLKGPVIVGFHTAGDTTVRSGNKLCAGVMIYREEIQSFLDDIEEEVFQEVVAEVDPKLAPEGGCFSGHPVIGNARKVPMPKGSKIQRSKLADYLPPPVSGPAQLQSFYLDGVLIDPADKALRKYVHDEPYIDSDALDAIYPYASELILKTTAEELRECRILTFEEAVSGVDGVDFLDGIKRSTSAGYPYIFETKGRRGKTLWFGEDGEVDFDNVHIRSVRERVEQIIDDARKGIRHVHLFVDHLKDELRPIEKVREGKTRQIMTCPMDFLIAVKMYFGDFMRHVLENRIFNGMAPGIDPMTEWDTLVKWLTSVRKSGIESVNIIGGDYSGFDTRIPVPISYVVLDIIQDFYGDDGGTKVRHVLFHEIINSLHTRSGKVYEFIGSNPSGQPLTTIFNSMANIVILMYCTYKHAQEKDDIAGWRSGIGCLRIVTYGDDVLAANEADKCGVWLQRSLEYSVPKYVGMEFTDDKKDGTSSDRRTIFDVTFLKRSFRYELGKWYCPLDLNVLLETLKWNKKDTSEKEMSERIKCVFVELARHGKRVFHEHAPVIRHAALRAGYQLPDEYKYDAALSSEEGLDF